KELCLEEVVFLTGFIDNPYPYLKRANLFAHTAHWEGMPVSMIEAMAFGTPVVSTDCPHGPRELLHHGELGKLVPIADDKELANAMLDALENTAEPTQLREAVTRFTIRSSARAYLDAMGF
ncbi:MAG: glycosyltransferase, partial [Chromatiaceae bacterium]